MEVDLLWITGAIGAIIGALVAFVCNFYLQDRKEKQEIKAIRTLLKLEFQNNLNKLKKIFIPIITEELSEDDFHIIQFLHGLRLVQYDVINLKKDLWDKKTPIYAISLKEHEIILIESLYVIFENAINIHSEMRSIYCKMDSEYNYNNPAKEWVDLNTSLGKKWEEFEKEAMKVVERGDYLISELEN